MRCSSAEPRGEWDAPQIARPRSQAPYPFPCTLPCGIRELTQGRQVSVDDLRAVVSRVADDVPKEQLDALLALDVDQYVGNAREAALAVGDYCSFEGEDAV